MISLLYRDWLCLATGSKVEQVYTIQACIPLTDMKLEDPDNGRGRLDGYADCPIAFTRVNR